MDLDKLNDEQLLSLRFCELGLDIEKTPLAESVARFYEELANRNILFHPRCYLADEWLCPDEEPVIGIAFFLAHPRLRKLEHKMMLEVEGGDKTSFMKLLRHEAGHAMNYAYSFHRRKRWKQLFGPFNARYPDRYRYRPYSKRFVRHLAEWYAQYHPDEDFAETFAVWLDPSSNWRDKYKGWKALEKLEYVDALMKEIAGQPPRKGSGRKHWDVSKMRTRLVNHYRQRRRFQAETYPDFHDPQLNKIFLPPDEGGKKKRRQTARKLIRKHRKEILDRVALWTGEKKFLINRLLKDIISRCGELALETGEDEAKIVMETAVYVTAQTMNYLYTGRYRKKNEKAKNACHV